MTNFTLPFATLQYGSFSPGRLATEIETALPVLGRVIVERQGYDARDLMVRTSRPLTAAEKTTVTATVAAHLPDSRYLPTVRSNKYDAIDYKTKNIIGQGFVFNGVRLSLSENMQKNLLGAMQLKDNAAIYPMKFNAIDDSGNITVADATELQNLFAAAILAVRVAWDSGTALKEQVRAATTVEQINAVVDAR